ncbi:MAG: alanine--tRNA ligase [Thermoplasmata archaeon]
MSDPLDLEILHNRGFVRKKCEKCGATFWTSDPDRNTCGEFPCDPYIFLDKRIMKEEINFYEMMDKFIEFFKSRNHGKIERFPVVARWRKDVFLVNASIYDFQPHITSGEVPPSANPLVVAQPCIRLVDIDDVGKTGRHLTSFIMMAHHAFNYPDKYVYWKDETVSYALDFLESLGIDKNYITLKENPWTGGGNGGYAFEVIVGGLEVATLVFMEFIEDPNGDIELNGQKFRKMDIRVVDTGYGLERFVWVSKSSPSIFDAIYSDIINRILEISNKKFPESYNEFMKRFVSIKDKSEDVLIEWAKKIIMDLGLDDSYIDFLNYIRKIELIVDHTRSALFMLNDGAVPSNVKSGYLARFVLRRLFRVLEETNLIGHMDYIFKLEMEYFKSMLDEEMFPVIMDMVKVEYERYKENIKKSENIIEKYLQKGNVDLDTLIQLYDSYGILPEIVAEKAKEKGILIKIPENFRSIVASKHERSQEKEKEKTVKLNLKPTRTLYYEDPYMKEFDANIIFIGENFVVLDQTAFYPEGGGQPSDLGYIMQDEKKYFVKDVQKYGDVILHYLENENEMPRIGKVHGVINWDRRARLMRNHTATHILLHSCRKILGKHVWQAGAQKDVLYSRLDITHYKRISNEEIRQIEKEAMKIITECVPVSAEWMDRNEAEKLYGFRLYEGGIPPGEKIRVVKVGNYDAEGCGGTHVKNTGEIGFIKIIKEERIQDGVSRIIFTSWLGAIEEVHKIENILNISSGILKVEHDKLPKTIERFFEEWKELKKYKEKMQERIIYYIIEDIKNKKIDIKNGKISYGEVEKDILFNVAKLLKEKKIDAILKSENLIGIVDSGNIKIPENIKYKDVGFIKIIEGAKLDDVVSMLEVK